MYSLTALFLAASVTALPGLKAQTATMVQTAALESRTSGRVCPNILYSVPACCSVDILGVADLSCSTPREGNDDAEDFVSSCADQGKEAKCCTLELAGLGVLCFSTIGA